jgi:hypothetical protein
MTHEILSISRNQWLILEWSNGTEVGKFAVKYDKDKRDEAKEVNLGQYIPVDAD